LLFYWLYLGRVYRPYLVICVAILIVSLSGSFFLTLFTFTIFLLSISMFCGEITFEIIFGSLQISFRNFFFKPTCDCGCRRQIMSPNYVFNWFSLIFRIICFFVDCYLFDDLTLGFYPSVVDVIHEFTRLKSIESIKITR
jgi:hypothetical protein